MEVIINKKMFMKGGPFFNVTNLITLFNDHGPEGVAEYPKGKKGSYHPNGTKVEKTKEELEAEKKKAEEAKAANNGTEVAVVSADDDQLEDTPAVQVMEVKFVNGDTMDSIPVKNLTKGMLKICMMKRKEKQKMMYANEENGQLQEDGMTKESEVAKSTQDTTG